MEKPISLDDLPPDCLIPLIQAIGILDCGNLSLTCKYFNNLIKEDSLWKSLALDKWGPAVETLAAPIVPNGGWLAYCSHRMNLTAAPKSPLDLAQEQYPDPWSHLVCCILCSRTSGGPLIRATLQNFITCWPTPSAVLATTDDVLAEAINPLGLQLNRIKALKSMSHDFLNTEWESPMDFSGCGKFSADSWRVFCRGHRQLEDVEDKNLRRYLQWVLNSSNGKQVSKEKANKNKKTSKSKEVKGGSKIVKKSSTSRNNTTSYSSKTRGGHARLQASSKGAGSSATARGIKTNTRRQTR